VATVDATAGELERDLGSGVAAATAPSGVDPWPASPSDGYDPLIRRIEALESGALRHDRLVRRMLDLLGSVAERG
jgi:hypothetical protein